ncbi:MAG: hypothetical protein R2873_17405 [Caldilineaceae bacterium]
MVNRIAARMTSWLTHTCANSVGAPRPAQEVVFAIRQPNGKILLHTKPQYEERFYRLPSGGIRPFEPVEDALLCVKSKKRPARSSVCAVSWVFSTAVFTAAATPPCSPATSSTWKAHRRA